MKLSLDFGPDFDLHPGITLRLTGSGLSQTQFEDVCRRNDGFRFEREPSGELIVRPLMGGACGLHLAALNTQVAAWAAQTGAGVPLGTGAAMRLRNGAVRSPGAACVGAERWAALREPRSCCLPFCADWVAEIVSPFDDRAVLVDKMLEYREGGARLAWLFDPSWRTVDVFRPHEPVRRLENMTHITEMHPSPVLPGFVLDLRRVWNAGAVI